MGSLAEHNVVLWSLAELTVECGTWPNLVWCLTELTVVKWSLGDLSTVVWSLAELIVVVWPLTDLTVVV